MVSPLIVKDNHRDIFSLHPADIAAYDVTCPSSQYQPDRGRVGIVQGQDAGAYFHGIAAIINFL